MGSDSNAPETLGTEWVVCPRYKIEDYREAFGTLMGRSAVGKVCGPADM